MNSVKKGGKVYTPNYLVDIILDQGGYIKGNINKKHVIDNSCGNGQFLVQIVDRYCKDFIKKNDNLLKLKVELEEYIHGIEIDIDELNIAKERCSKIVESYGIYDVNWDFIQGNTLKINKYDGKMDFVVGNPPYVRIHNMRSEDRGKGQGMIDLYILFYDKGIEMLNDNGVLCYITPSSFFTSGAGKDLRKKCIQDNLLKSVCDLKHFQAFNATTYTAIITMDKRKVPYLAYYLFDDKTLGIELVEYLHSQDYYIGGNFYFSNIDNLKMLKKIFENTAISDVEVKNGFATLADKIFIGNHNFPPFCIDIIKSSTSKRSKCIYPYDQNGKLISLDTISKKNKKLYEYFLIHKEILSNKKGDSSWYAFGRSQGIKDTNKERLSLNTLIRNKNDLKLTIVPAGCGVYGGLYILSSSHSLEKIRECLETEEFADYIMLLGKYKSGGYYTYSSKDVKAYLDYAIRD